MFVAPYARSSEYSGEFYHYTLLHSLLEQSIRDSRIFETQKEVNPEALRKAARYTYLQRCEQAGFPKFLDPEERAELFKLGHDIAEKIVISPPPPKCSISGPCILQYLKNHAVKTYDWPKPEFPK